MHTGFQQYALACALALVPAGACAESFDIEGAAVAYFEAFSRIQAQHEPVLVEPSQVINVQDYLVALMRPTWGMDVGYLADAAADAEMPPTGILLENMFTGTRAVVTRDFGIEMLAAGELMFRVGSEDINSATTREDALAALQSVIPAVRMSDQLLAADARRNPEQHMAANLQIRMYVLGNEVELADDVDWVERLPKVGITLLDQDKQQLAASSLDPGRTHPIDAVLRMRDALNSRGIALKSDDVLGIGAWTEGYPVADLSRLAAVFDGVVPNQPMQVYMGFK